MKKIVIKTAVVLIVLALVVSAQVFADAPPDPGGDPTGGNPVGGGSPIGGGLIFMLTLGIAYGTKKIMTLRKKILN
ncbi:MAG: hypothetical protein K9G76_04120 [Bacteroidales bacterium]|nr:hypothetical protein [Bacteroidales bacterium]MCF8403609.1 hypothetical protein [Bacteroidales bacterium]